MAIDTIVVVMGDWRDTGVWKSRPGAYIHTNTMTNTSTNTICNVYISYMAIGQLLVIGCRQSQWSVCFGKRLVAATRCYNVL